MLKTPGGDREMAEILARVLQHDEQAVLTAGEWRRRPVRRPRRISGTCCVLVDGKPVDPPAVKPPNA